MFYMLYNAYGRNHILHEVVGVTGVTGVTEVEVGLVMNHVYTIHPDDRINMLIDDRHNVHNATLKRHAMQVIVNLKQSDQHKYTIESAITDILDMIEMNPDTNLDLLESAKNVLESINDINATYHNAYITEKEILRLVWERINHPINQSVVDQLKSNLIEELADCVNNYSGLQCCEGRIMRILQTLESCDKESIVNLRPMWAYKEEISNKILKYRQKLLLLAPDIYRKVDAKITLNDNDKVLIKQFNDCLKSNLEKRFNIDYIQSGLMSTTELHELTMEYYNEL